MNTYVDEGVVYRTLHTRPTSPLFNIYYLIVVRMYILAVDTYEVLQVFSRLVWRRFFARASCNRPGTGPREGVTGLRSMFSWLYSALFVIGVLLFGCCLFCAVTADGVLVVVWFFCECCFFPSF